VDQANDDERVLIVLGDRVVRDGQVENRQRVCGTSHVDDCSEQFRRIPGLREREQALRAGVPTDDDPQRVLLVLDAGRAVPLERLDDRGPNTRLPGIEEQQVLEVVLVGAPDRGAEHHLCHRFTHSPAKTGRLAPSRHEALPSDSVVTTSWATAPGEPPFDDATFPAWFDVTILDPTNRLGVTPGSNAWRPDLVGDPMAPHPTADAWLNPAAFAIPRNADGTYRYGYLGRNTLRGPGYFNLDAALTKEMGLGGARRLQLRWEVFNLTNHPSFSLPNTELGSTDFGTIRSTVSTPRQMQFGVKFLS
jgi:hypothetical protein